MFSWGRKDDRGVGSILIVFKELATSDRHISPDLMYLKAVK